MKKTNILHLTTAFVIGGAEKVVLDLLKNLDNQSFNVSIIALAHNTDMLQEYLDSGIKAEKLDMQKGFGGMITVLKYLDRYITENNIDIIHAHLFHPLPIASLLKIIASLISKPRPSPTTKQLRLTTFCSYSIAEVVL